VEALTRASLVALGAGLALAPAASAAPPDASFSVSPASPRTLETVTFTSTSSGDIDSERWDLDNEGGCDDGSGPSAQRSFPVAGTYRITLCVSGPEGDAQQSRNVTVTNQQPVASLVQTPGSPETRETVTFVSTSKDPDGPIESQKWDLDGDGAFDDGDEVTASRRFSRPGTYTVGLLVTDRDGAQGTITKTILVRPSLLEPFPTVRIRGVLEGGGIRIRLFEVDAPRGARVRIHCRGSGCPKPRKAAAARLRRFRRYEVRLAAGAVLEVFVRKPGTVGKYTRFSVRRGRAPARRDRCLFPGEKRPLLCPAG
jgi:hypothetical protein